MEYCSVRIFFFVQMFASIAQSIGGIELDPQLAYNFPLTGNKNSQSTEPPQPNESLPSTFHFACWNIYKGKKKNFQESFNRFVSHCDLYAIQEAKLSIQHSETSSSPANGEVDDEDDEAVNLGMGQMTSQFLKRGQPSGTFNGSSTICRWVKNYRTETIEPVVGTPKSATMTRYQIDDGKGGINQLLLINLHWLNWTSDEDWLRELEIVCEEVPANDSNSNEIVIVAGDFNTRSQWRIDQLMNLLVTRKGLHLDLQANYNRKKIFDFIFTKGLKVLSTDTIRSDGSDHPLLKVKYVVA